jgi:biotin carboxyl carrier protein
MEKYRVSIGDKEYLVEIDGERVRVDGQEVYAGIHFLNDEGLFMVEKDESKREYHIKSQGESSYRVTTRGLQVDAVVEPEHGRARKRAEKKDAGAITAPIPGVVTNVQVEEGQQVEHNQVVVVLESMKMLMEFRAPFAGAVEKVCVKKGQKLEKGDEMVRIKRGE